MSLITKQEIEEMVMEGNNGEYSHVLICVDKFSYEYYPVYVKYGENIKNKIAEYDGGIRSLNSVMEIYNYNLDLHEQLNERRAYHIEPTTKKMPSAEKKVKNLSEVDKAINYAINMHSGQVRDNGSPYVSHPIAVANYVAMFKKSSKLDMLKICAYLHDTLEDTDATYYDLVELFGPQVASIVLELTNDEDLKRVLGKEKYLEIKMKNMTSWALVIKLCDRLDNVSDLKYQDEEFRIRYTNETINILLFIVRNRYLSETHINIITKIIGILLELDLDKENINKLSTIQDLLKTNHKCHLKRTLKKEVR